METGTSTIRWKHSTGALVGLTRPGNRGQGQQTRILQGGGSVSKASQVSGMGGKRQKSLDAALPDQHGEVPASH